MSFQDSALQIPAMMPCCVVHRSDLVRRRRLPHPSHPWRQVASPPEPNRTEEALTMRPSRPPVRVILVLAIPDRLSPDRRLVSLSYTSKPRSRQTATHTRVWLSRLEWRSLKS